jgi:Flp pilus assembly CpaF family ATPase
MDTTAPSPHTDAIREALQRNDNILISGGPSSGKTTFLDTLVNEAARMHHLSRRTVIIQADCQELHIPEHANVLALRANVEQEDAVRGHYIIGFSELLSDLLEFGAPIDSLVFGDILNQDAARALLIAERAGIRGFLGNIHARGGVNALYRLEMLLGLNHHMLNGHRKAIARFVQLTVHCEMTDARKRYISDVSRVIGVDATGEYVLEEVKRRNG